MSTVEIIDRDEAFWREVRELPSEIKNAPHMLKMLVFKSQATMLNRDIEKAIRLNIAGWVASSPDGTLEMDRVFAWQWRRPGPRGGRLFLSTDQAMNALAKEGTTKLLTGGAAP